MKIRIDYAYATSTIAAEEFGLHDEGAFLWYVHEGYEPYRGKHNGPFSTATAAVLAAKQQHPEIAISPDSLEWIAGLSPEGRGDQTPAAVPTKDRAA